MNHDDVIRLAKEAGLYVGTNASGVTLVGHKYQRFYNTGMIVHMDVNDMAKFAALVAAYVRETEFKPDWNNYQQGLIDGAAEEREACIEILSRTEFTSLEHMPSEAALLIRARGGDA